MSLTSSSRLEALVELRRILAERINDPEVSDRDLASLSLRFLDVISEIEELGGEEPEEKGTALDEFSRRLAERRSRASG